MKKTVKQAAALKYDRERDSAPKVVAKGKGEAAGNIIKIAQLHNLPIKKDEDLVELLSKVEIDKEIPMNLYVAVAEIFRFIYDVTNDTREDGRV